jgi:branched-chain amino acid aminotransferase
LTRGVDAAPAAPAPAGPDGDAVAALPALWVDGRRAEPGGAHVSAFDRGLTLADGLFETVRVYAGTAFRLDAHLARLAAGLARLEIALPAEARDWLLAALAAAPGVNAALRVTVTRGAAGGGVLPPAAAGGVRPTVIAALQPLPPFPARLYTEGLTAHVASGRRNERAMTAGLKTLAYADAVVAMLEARRAGADEALFLDGDGHCSEASASNLFACLDGRLVTPPLSCGALPGITRAAVLELAGALGLPADERPFGLDELLGAREAFLTSSLRELAPLVRVGGRALGAGAPGPVTRELAAAIAALVRRESAPRA